MKKIAIIIGLREQASYILYTQPLISYFSKYFEVHVFDQHSLHNITKNQFSLFYFVKLATPAAYELALYAKNNNIPIIYETDDNFLAPSVTESTHEQIHLTPPQEVRLLKLMLNLASLTLVYSKKSHEMMRPYNANIAILPTYQNVYTKKPPQVSTDTNIIGFMGSQLKGANFTWVVPALKKISKKYPDATFEFFGFVPSGAEELPLVAAAHYDPDYHKFITFFTKRNWAIALAPLIEADFNLSKTNVKYREYAAAGYPGIYSNIEPYANTVRHNETGMLVNNTEEDWFTAIDTLLQNENLRQTLITNAWEDIYDHYSFEKYCNVKMFAFTNLMADSSEENITRIIEKIKNKNKQISY